MGSGFVLGIIATVLFFVIRDDFSQEKMDKQRQRILDLETEARCTITELYLWHADTARYTKNLEKLVDERGN